MYHTIYNIAGLKSVKQKTSLSIVIPAYNEEESLGYVLRDTLKDVPKVVKDYEVIVVDDGSEDNTPQIADSYAKKNRHVRVIHQRQGGFNKAMITGLRRAKKRLCCLHARRRSRIDKRYD